MPERLIVPAGGGAGLRLRHADVAPDGRLSFLPPKTRAGASITLRAETDLSIALSFVPRIHVQRRRSNYAVGFEIVSA